jgi:hypothetical protein
MMMMDPDRRRYDGLSNITCMGTGVITYTAELVGM